jgi:hypothetical protein
MFYRLFFCTLLLVASARASEGFDWHSKAVELEQARGLQQSR